MELVCNLLRLTARYAPKIQEVALAIELASHGDPDIAAAFEDRMAQRRRGFARAVSAAKEVGRLVEDWSVERIVDVIWAMGRPTFYESIVTERGWSITEYERLLVDTFGTMFVARGARNDSRSIWR